MSNLKVNSIGPLSGGQINISGSLTLNGQDINTALSGSSSNTSYITEDDSGNRVLAIDKTTVYEFTSSNLLATGNIRYLSNTDYLSIPSPSQATLDLFESLNPGDQFKLTAEAASATQEKTLTFVNTFGTGANYRVNVSETNLDGYQDIPAVNTVTTYTTVEFKFTGTGTITINGTEIGDTDLNGIEEDIVPLIDSVYDLGTKDKKFYDGYFTNKIQIGDSISIINDEGDLVINGDIIVNDVSAESANLGDLLIEGSKISNIKIGEYETQGVSVDKEFEVNYEINTLGNAVWSSAPGLNTPRTNHISTGDSTSALVATGNLYGGTVITSVEKYNGISWSEQGSSPSNMSYSAAAAGDASHTLINGVFNGYNVNPTLGYTVLWNNIGWYSGAPSITARQFHAAVGSSSSHVLMFGGRFRNEFGVGYPVTTSELYDDDVWSTAANLPSAISNNTGVGDKFAALSIGGFDSSTTSNSNSTFEFDGSAWSTSTPTLIPFNLHASSGESIYSANVYGGQDNGNYPFANKETHHFNGTTWTVQPNLPVQFQEGAAAGTSNSSVLSGGRSNSNTPHVNSYIFDAESVLLTVPTFTHTKDNTTVTGDTTISGDTTITGSATITGKVNAVTGSFDHLVVSSSPTIPNLYLSDYSTADDIGTALTNLQESIDGLGDGGSSVDLTGIADDIIPLLDSVYDLGTSEKKFYDGYFANKVQIGNSTSLIADEEDLVLTGDLIVDNIATETINAGDILIEDSRITNIKLGDYGNEGVTVDSKLKIGTKKAIINPGIWTTSTTTLNQPRSEFAMDGKLNSGIAAAGRIGFSSPINSTETYDGSTWSVAADLATPSSELGYRGYLAGDSLDAIFVEGGEFNLTQVNTYNGSVWQIAPEILAQVVDPAIAGNSSAAFMFGGREGASDNPIKARSQEFDGITWTFKPATTIERRFNPAGVGVVNDVTAIGGNGFDENYLLNNFSSTTKLSEYFDGTSWSTLQSTNASVAIDYYTTYASGETNNLTVTENAVIDNMTGEPKGLPIVETYDGVAWSQEQPIPLYISNFGSLGSGTSAVVTGGVRGVGPDPSTFSYSFEKPITYEETSTFSHSSVETQISGSVKFSSTEYFNGVWEASAAPSISRSGYNAHSATYMSGDKNDALVVTFPYRNDENNGYILGEKTERFDGVAWTEAPRAPFTPDQNISFGSRSALAGKADDSLAVHDLKPGEVGFSNLHGAVFNGTSWESLGVVVSPSNPGFTFSKNAAVYNITGGPAAALMTDTGAYHTIKLNNGISEVTFNTTIFGNGAGLVGTQNNALAIGGVRTREAYGDIALCLKYDGTTYSAVASLPKPRSSAQTELSSAGDPDSAVAYGGSHYDSSLSDRITATDTTVEYDGTAWSEGGSAALFFTSDADTSDIGVDQYNDHTPGSGDNGNIMGFAPKTGVAATYEQTAVYRSSIEHDSLVGTFILQNVAKTYYQTDAEAAIAGIPIGGLYRNSDGFVKIRLS